MHGISVLFCAVALLAASPVASADWWDDFTASVSEKLHDAADWVKEKASPAVRDKFNAVKETLQDPETHKAAKEWISDKAEKVSDFAQAEVIPELKKVYEAATSSDSNHPESH